MIRNRPAPLGAKLPSCPVEQRHVVLGLDRQRPLVGRPRGEMPLLGDVRPIAEHDVEMIAHRAVVANLDREEPRQLAQPTENPPSQVAVVVPLVRVHPAEERPSDASRDAVTNPDLVFADDLAPGVSRHRSDSSERRTVATETMSTVTVMDKISIGPAVSSTQLKRDRSPPRGATWRPSSPHAQRGCRKLPPRRVWVSGSLHQTSSILR